MVKVTYIFHDCFVVETGSATLIFDFWKDIYSKKVELCDFIRNADKDKALYVFVSHHHKDHYSKQIFQWENLFKKITFIISKDVARFARHIISKTSVYSGFKPDPKNIKILSPGEHFSDGTLKVEAFGSTDIGNSYYVEIADDKAGPVSLFHAGDLNAWLWMDESTDEEIVCALSAYEIILKELSDSHPEIDYVMFPVDSRIGRGFATGANLFVRKIRTGHFFPMHFALYENEEERIKRALDASDVTGYANLEYGEYITLMTPYSCYLTK